MWRMVILFLALAACDTTGRHFRDSPVTRVTVEGSVFDVRVRGNLAEALRINAQYAPPLLIMFIKRLFIFFNCLFLLCFFL